MIFELDNTLVSGEILTQKFLCDLLACKGACCVEGDAGAPLTNEEVELLEREYDNIKDYLTEEGKQVIEKQGIAVLDEDGEPVTPLMEDETCAFAIKDKQGILKCGIEQAHLDQKTEFRKPISCHLYPIRVSKIDNKDVVNYHRWSICKPACKKGKEEDLTVAEFAKTALVRKFGQKWYDDLMTLRKEYFQ